MMQLPVSPESLLQFAGWLESFMEDRATERSSLSSMIGNLLSASYGWKGRGSAEFQTSWASTISAEGHLTENAEAVIHALVNVVGGLRDAQQLVNAANAAAETDGLHISSDGDVSDSGWQRVNPVDIWRKLEIEQKVSDASDAISFALNRAAAAFSGVTPADAGSPWLPTKGTASSVDLAVNTDYMCIVSVDGMRPMESSTSSAVTSLQGQVPEACSVGAFGATRFSDALGDATEILVRSLQSLSGMYEGYANALLAAADTYLGSDTRAQELAAQLASGQLTTQRINGVIKLAPSENASIRWAQSELTKPSHRYIDNRFLCYVFVTEALAQSGIDIPSMTSAAQAYTAWSKLPGFETEGPPPKGALVLYSWRSADDGHIALSIGNGQVICTSDGVQPVEEVPYAIGDRLPLINNGSNIMTLAQYNPKSPDVTTAGTPIYLGWIMPENVAVGAH